MTRGLQLGVVQITAVWRPLRRRVGSCEPQIAIHRASNRGVPITRTPLGLHYILNRSGAHCVRMSTFSVTTNPTTYLQTFCAWKCVLRGSLLASLRLLVQGTWHFVNVPWPRRALSVNLHSCGSPVRGYPWFCVKGRLTVRQQRRCSLKGDTPDTPFPISKCKYCGTSPLTST